MLAVFVSEAVDDGSDINVEDEVRMDRDCVTVLNLVDCGIDGVSEGQSVEDEEPVVKLVEGVSEISVTEVFNLVVLFPYFLLAEVALEVDVGYFVSFVVKDEKDGSETRDIVPSDEMRDAVDEPVILFVDSGVMAEEGAVYEDALVLSDDFKTLVEVV